MNASAITPSFLPPRPLPLKKRREDVSEHEGDPRIPKSQRGGVFEAIYSEDLEALRGLRERLLATGNFRQDSSRMGKDEETGPGGLISTEGYFGGQERKRQWRLWGTFHGHENHPGLAYSARIIEEKDHGPGYWKTGDIGVFRGEELIGTYQRGYPSLFQTFEAFSWQGKLYALYSHDYQHTSAMSLPDCQEVAAEPEGERGFCPTAYWVPINPATGEADGWGLVSGCVWGDDSSWKVEYLDLREIEQGVIRRDARFGYLELDRNDTLKDAISWLAWYWDSTRETLRAHHCITIRHGETFDLATGESHERAAITTPGTPGEGYGAESSKAGHAMVSVANGVTVAPTSPIPALPDPRKQAGDE